MNHRAQQTWLLCATYLDWTPGPSTWRNNPLNWRTDSGEAPSQTIVCQTCQGEGKTRGNRCGHCLGRGVRTVDTYTGVEVSTYTRPVTRTHPVACDSCAGQGAYGNGRRCPYCHGTGRVELAGVTHTTSHQPRHNHGSDALDRQAAQWRQGSYPELQTALNWLEHAHADQHQAVWRYLINPVDVHVGPRLRTLLEASVTGLSYRMPHRIRVPAWATPQPARTGNGRWANTHAQQHRDQRIRDAHAGGLSTGELAVEHGLTRRRIQEITRG